MQTKPISVNQYRTHTCGELTASNDGENVTLSGWVHSRRDHGGLIFIDLRDKWGITQLTFNPANHIDTHTVADTLRSEYVIKASGQVTCRPPAMVNPNLPTGEIEIAVTAIEILGTSKTPPFEVARDNEVNEELRLKYRFLDLRHPRLQFMLKQRDKFIRHIRAYMNQQGFTDVQTPILANSSPEGARDYLVPSRLYPGKFYALPQAPQQFKQLLMVGSLDRYFQIAPCFRDEDPRADRHAGDFYQLDLEMSFVEQEDIFAVVEPLMIELTEKFSQKKIITQPFPRVTWHEAMEKYGTDKPDLRFKFYIHNISKLVNGSNFKVFQAALDLPGTGMNDGRVHALHVPGGASLTRKDLDNLSDLAKQSGAQGLAYILLKDELTSPLLKHLGEDVVKSIINHLAAQKGDAIFFAADSFTNVAKVLGIIRNETARLLGAADTNRAAWVWVTDFPMYEYNQETDKIDFSHNPFSMPQGGLDALSASDPTTILGYQYDLALNGFEISSGAIRNHRPDIMYKAFEIAGYSKAQVDEKFGGMIRAFEYGAPPHGGLAPGLDRLLYLLLDLNNIRDIYAFPKDGKARDLMMGSPSSVSQQQLTDLQLKIED